MEIRRLGSYQEVDAQGYLTKIADASKIQDEWVEVINSAKHAYLEKWSEAIHSIYVRGSIAKGWAVKGVSDVDSLAVFKEGTYDFSDFNDWWEATSKMLQRAFPSYKGARDSPRFY